MWSFRTGDFRNAKPRELHSPKNWPVQAARSSHDELKSERPNLQRVPALFFLHKTYVSSRQKNSDLAEMENSKRARRKFRKRSAPDSDEETEPQQFVNGNENSGNDVANHGGDSIQHETGMITSPVAANA